MNRKIALVTGGNRGIGKEIVRQLAARGVKVYLAARDAGKAAAAAEEIRRGDSGAGEIVTVELDVTHRDSVRRAASEVSKNEAALDILVNNAGINLHDEDCGVLDLPEDVLARVLDTNFYGPLRCAQAFAPLLKMSEAGRIVNVSSQMGLLTTMENGYPSYRISKTALNALTRILNAELKSSNVAVNCMCPGWVRTDMGGEDAPGTAAQGADTAVYLALELPHGESGNFYLDRKAAGW